MSTLGQDIRNFVRSSDTLSKLILINIFVFLVIGIFSLVAFLGNQSSEWVQQIQYLLSLPAAPDLLIRRPWSLITYMFMHEGILHILFNMLWLYWMGSILSEYLGEKRLLSTFFLGGLSGAFLYIASFNLFPVFSDVLPQARAIGASAAVMAIVVATATLLPNYGMRLFIIGDVPLKYIALFYLALDLISIPGGNAGGHIAHLGGALYGFIFIRQLQKGNDLSAWFDKLTQVLRKRRGPKKAYVNPNYELSYTASGKVQTGTKQRRPSTEEDTEEKLNKILDKISASGYESLSKEEKEFLLKMGEK